MGTSHRQSEEAPGSRRSADRPASVWALVFLLAIQAIGAISGGVGLVQDPINNIGLPLSLLEGAPFHDYLIPGLILLVVVGFFPAAVLVGLLRGYRWAWWLAIAAGGGLLIWIATEVALLGDLPGAGIGLQIGMAILALLIVVLALVGSTRRFYRDRA
jgi:hypothetical protein